LAYGDGAVWVANPDGIVTELNASNGAAIGSYSACGGSDAGVDVAYSGGDVWVACSDSVVELDATDGSLIASYDVSTGAARYLTVSDGDVWVAGGTGQNGTLTELSAATGAVIATQNLQEVAPTGILSDGTNIWVASDDTLVGINASTGSLVLNDIGVNLGTYGTASMTFDGSHIWATTGTGGLVEIDDPVS
jgi:DNA-binding beta-propeller fold protein YncE